MRELIPTPRTTVRRRKERGRYDLETIHAILDEAMICHLGFALDGRPWVIPTAFVRIGDDVYVHGATGNHALCAVADGAPACVTVTLVDGLVLARSTFHHSINYRSLVLFGDGHRVDDPDTKAEIMNALVEHLVPGRTAEARAARADELRATLIVRIPIEEASAKVRTGGPADEAEDLALPVWAGVIPLGLDVGDPIPDADLDGHLLPPTYVSEYAR